MQKFVGDHIPNLKPYQPGKPIEELERELGISDIIKLASNENPLGPSPKAIESMQKMLSGTHIYPDGATFYVREAIAAFMNVSMSEVIMSNGSNEVLTLVARTFCLPGDNVVLSDYSFIMYRLAAMYMGIPITWVPTSENLGHDLDAMAAAIDENTKIVYIANPNNPTGTYNDRKTFERFLRTIPKEVIVVVDEAYIEYALAEDYASVMTMREIHERLIITRTFSKCYGLAGLRIGFAVGPPKLIDYMNRVRDPFNLNLLAQYAAQEALKDTKFVQKSIEMNEKGRIILEKGLADLAELGVTWIPSQTNFILIKTPYEGDCIYNAMLQKGVIIRPMKGYGLSKHLRITIGLPNEIERCVKGLREALEECKLAAQMKNS